MYEGEEIATSLTLTLGGCWAFLPAFLSRRHVDTSKEERLAVRTRAAFKMVMAPVFWDQAVEVVNN
jgi:hypothetical protein